MQVRSVIARRPLATSLAIAGLAAMIFGLFWFQPHKLFIDQQVDEAAPAESAATEATGDFVSHAHGTTGRAMLLTLDDGSRLLRLENFATDNGPDLRVYLSSAAATESGDAVTQDFVDLGGLKGNMGNQNYEVPAEVDLSRFESVVIWCRRFSVAFGAAALD